MPEGVHLKYVWHQQEGICLERATRQLGVPKATVKCHEDGSNIYAVEEKRVAANADGIHQAQKGRPASTFFNYKNICLEAHKLY
jgi:hypothetical protein